MALLAQGSWQGNKFILPTLPDQPSLLRPHTPANAVVGSGYSPSISGPRLGIQQQPGGGDAASAATGPGSAQGFADAAAGIAPSSAQGWGGLLGGVAGLTSGVPGIGTLGSLAGMGFDFANQSGRAAELGIAEPSLASALANSMTMGVFGTTPAAQVDRELDLINSWGFADAAPDFGGYGFGPGADYGGIGFADMGVNSDMTGWDNDFASAALAGMAAENASQGLTSGGNVSGFGSGGASGEGASSSTGSTGIGESSGTGAGGNSSFGGDGGAGGAGGASVICTALYMDGKLDRQLWIAAGRFGRSLDREAYQGYLIWGRKIAGDIRIVRKLEKLGCAWAKEMAFRIGASNEGSKLGAAILAVCIPFSRMVYRANKWYSLALNAFKYRKLGRPSKA
jgi:hypothetical protein